MTNSVTWLEAVWTLIAVVAIGFTAWIVDDNVRNFRTIIKAVRLGRARAWGPRYWLAVASLVSSAAMFVVWVGFAVIGVLAMTIAPDDPEPERVAVSVVSGWVLIAMTLLLAGIQAWQVYARTKIRPLILRAPDAPTPAPGGAGAVLVAPAAIDVAAEQAQVAAEHAQHAAHLVDALRAPEPDQEPTP